MLWTSTTLVLLVVAITHALPQVQESDVEEYEDTNQAETQQTRAVVYPDNYPYQNSIPVKQIKQQYREQDPQIRPKQNYPQQFRVQGQQQLQQQERLKDAKLKEEEEEEIEEPDRLSLLLPNSKFQCNGKNTGYYADEDLNCEVFHYCHDNAKHSWICPEGFTFHQVHLICMPPGGDNICSKSSNYHFVNEYLYKPVNLEEYQRKPNVSLKYADRYYPDHIYQQDEYEDEEPSNYRTSIRVKEQQQQQQQQTVKVPIARPTLRPETTLGQVFHSPNEVNIPLQQRRPQYQRYFE